MVTSPAATVDEYLGHLPPDRREAVATVRQVILANLPEGYEEVMQYRMIAPSILAKRLRPARPAGTRRRRP